MELLVRIGVSIKEYKYRGGTARKFGPPMIILRSNGAFFMERTRLNGRFSALTIVYAQQLLDIKPASYNPIVATPEQIVKLIIETDEKRVQYEQERHKSSIYWVRHFNSALKEGMDELDIDHNLGLSEPDGLFRKRMQFPFWDETQHLTSLIISRVNDSFLSHFYARMGLSPENPKVNTPQYKDKVFNFIVASVLALRNNFGSSNNNLDLGSYERVSRESCADLYKDKPVYDEIFKELGATLYLGLGVKLGIERYDIERSMV